MKATFRGKFVKPLITALCLAAAACPAAAPADPAGNPDPDAALRRNGRHPRLVAFEREREGISEDAYRGVLSVLTLLEMAQTFGFVADRPNGEEVLDIIFSRFDQTAGRAKAALILAVYDIYDGYGVEDFKRLAGEVEKRDAEIIKDFADVKKRNDRAKALYDAYGELRDCYGKKAALLEKAREAGDLLLQKAAYDEYMKEKAGLFTAEAVPAEGVTGTLKLSFANNHGNYYVHSARFDMEVFPEGKDEASYLKTDIFHAFANPVAPGEFREETIPCDAGCQNALAAGNVRAVFGIRRLTGHTPDSFELVTLSLPRSIATDSGGGTDREQARRAAAIKGADEDIAAAREKIDKLLKED